MADEFDKLVYFLLGEEPPEKLPTKFKYMNKEYNYKANVLGLKNRVIKRDSRQVKDLIKLGYYIDESGAIPKIKAGQVIREKKYVQNPLNKKRMEYQGRQFNNFLKNGWKFDVNLGKLLAPSLGEVIPIWGIDGQLVYLDTFDYPSGVYSYTDGNFMRREPPDDGNMKRVITAMLKESTEGMKSAYLIAMHDSNDNDEYLHRNSKRMTYRYGKRMNYRYGKRAAMPFRFGKRNPEQNAQDFAEYIKQKQNLKRMNYRYGK